MAIMELENFMDIAINEAKKAPKHEDIPIGAIIIRDGAIIAKAHNEVEKLGDQTCHAELLAIKKAHKNLNKKRLDDCIMFVTCEPCIMCASAIIHARIKKVVFGCPDKKWGGFGTILDISNHPKLNHKVEIESGVKEKECAKLLSEFFEKLRR